MNEQQKIWMEEAPVHTAGVYIYDAASAGECSCGSR